MTVKEFWESKDRLAIQCNTREKAIKLLDKFNELGKHWRTGCDTYVSARHYEYEENTCYSNQGTYGSTYGFTLGCTILQFDDLDDFKQDKQKETIMKEENKTNCKFKVGDKVRVRKDLEIKIYKRNEDTVIYVTNKMLKYKGQVFTIDTIDERGAYRLNENCYWWSDEMLEPANKSSILDNVEFDYLWNIIKPFKDKVKWIQKYSPSGVYYIAIGIDNDDAIGLPYFPKDSSMYKGMEVDKKYTLEELGFVEAKPKLNCRVICIESDGTYFTVGKIYEFKDGHITFDNGEATAYSYESIEEFNKHNSYWKLLQIKE